MLPCKLRVKWLPFYCPHPDCRQKCKSNRGITYHLNHNPKCRTVTPYYHLKFQTGLSNKFQTPTAKKQRTSDTNSPFHSPPQFTNETYLEEDGCITASSYDEQVPRSPRVPHSWTLLNPSIPSQLMKKMNSKSTYPSCPWMLNPWTTSS